MKKALPTIIITIIFLFVIGAYAYGVIKIMSEEMTIETLLIPFIILGVFSVLAILVIFVLIKRVKAIKEEEKENLDDY
ncbi:MAG: hypothetical protein AB1Z23_05230 [Eubacteriales bacterium]